MGHTKDHAGVVAICVTAAVMSACSSGSSAPPTALRGPQTPPVPSRPGASPSLDTTTPTAGDTAQPSTASSAASPAAASRSSLASGQSVPQCRAVDLAVTDDGGQGAAGTFLGRLTFRNVSRNNCFLRGYPGFQRYDSAGRAVATVVKRIAATATTVTLAPGQRSSARYSYPDFGASPCPPAASSLHITPPGDTGFVTAASKMKPCGDRNGTVGVKPVVATVARLG